MAFPAALAGHVKGRRAVALMDTRTRVAAGERVAQAFRDLGWEVTERIVPDPAPGVSPVCDRATVDTLLAGLPPADVMVAVGSGVLCDLAKWLALERAVPSACVATAASMNGYSSPVIAAAIHGVKTVVQARPPLVVAAAPSVLCDAPHAMTAAGLGDVVARWSSSPDWRMDRELFGDYYCADAVSLAAGLEHLYMADPEALRNRSQPAVQALFEALLLTGVGMTMAGSSAPASGGEHLISHTLDMLALRDHRPHDLHGRQVGIGTVLALELYRRVLATEPSRWIAEQGAIDERYWGALSAAVRAEYDGKRKRYAEAGEKLSRPGAWDRLRGTLHPMVRPPSDIRDCLRRAGAAWRAEDIGRTCDDVRGALLHAREMRSRFTILDLAFMTGVLPGAAGAVIEEWA